MGSEERRRRYAALSERLALLDDEALGALVGRSGRSAWGWSGTVELDDGERVFVKRVPVTDLEAAHRHSTKNRFRLPVFYNYGVGSAGFGAYRELATHVRTTGWVLADEAEDLPLLLHARSLPRRPSGPDGWTGGADYVRSWNGSKRIGAFVEARAAASEELCLVLEHVPHSLWDWLLDHPEDTPRLLGRLCDAVTVLHDHGVLHFDAHFANAVTDGDRLCLTDFGLALDRAFELGPAEVEFFAAHQHYDYGEAIGNVGALLEGLAGRAAPEARSAIDDAIGNPPPRQRVVALVRGLDRLVDGGLLDVDPVLHRTITQYGEVVDFMWSFFGAMQTNRRKDTPFDDAELARLIDDAGGPPSAR